MKRHDISITLLAYDINLILTQVLAMIPTLTSDFNSNRFIIRMITLLVHWTCCTHAQTWT